LSDFQQLLQITELFYSIKRREVLFIAERLYHEPSGE
jgi:hypothetical protein